MFDRTCRNSFYGPDTVEVHHHRAPADASVRLLREMEKAAKDSVIAAYQVDNVFSVSVLEMQANEVLCTTDVLAVFSLNDERFRARVSTDLARLLSRGDERSAESAMRILFKTLSDEIAEQLMVKLAEKMSR